MTSRERTAIVTGASSGIGLGLAQALSGHGWNVVANSRRIRSAGTLQESDVLLLVDGDVAIPEVGARLVEAAVGRFGSLDLLVNNAGVFLSKPFTEYTGEDFATLLSTNLNGFFHVTQPAVRQMRKQKSGHIVNVSTTLVEQPLAEVPAAIPVLTKGGLDAVTRALAIEYASEGIRVNALAAGIIDTPMHRPEAHGFLRKLHPIQRLGTVSEVVDAALYLIDASFTTGETLHVDGGAHAGKW